jgi:ABC-type multidrug transport system permease subunit
MSDVRETPGAFASGSPAAAPGAPKRYWPLAQLVIARLREFYREPEAIFWVYGFPIIMTVALGIAFRNKPVDKIDVGVLAGPAAEDVAQKLRSRSEPDKIEFKVEIGDADKCFQRLRTGKIDIVVIPTELSGKRAYQYQLDKTRSESRLVRSTVHEALQVSEGRKDTAATLQDLEVTEPGSRYIDFLVPGLLGMSLMGGGLWGVGFVIVDMRLRKLLKRFLATPMKRSHFMLGIMISRLVFMIPEVLVLLVFARYAFGVVIYGDLLAVIALVILGAFTFAGIGLLVASRAKTLESVSGLMNVVMLPMWLLSGIFFRADRFPDVVQPFIKALPLTPLINALRAVMLEGATLASQWMELSILAGYGVVTFAIALKIFRWN